MKGSRVKKRMRLKGYEVRGVFQKQKKQENRKKEKMHTKAKKARQREKLITSSSHVQISKEKIPKKFDKERFLV